MIENDYVKDLTKINRDLKKIILIDNNSHNFLM